jgi:hypothetical protein
MPIPSPDGDVAREPPGFDRVPFLPGEVRQAVKTAGNSRKKVEAGLGGKK